MRDAVCGYKNDMHFTEVKPLKFDRVYDEVRLNIIDLMHFLFSFFYIVQTLPDTYMLSISNTENNNNNNIQVFIIGSKNCNMQTVEVAGGSGGSLAETGTFTAGVAGSYQRCLQTSAHCSL